jgi:hypothetical protein
MHSESNRVIGIEKSLITCERGKTDEQNSQKAIRFKFNHFTQVNSKKQFDRIRN